MKKPVLVGLCVVGLAVLSVFFYSQTNHGSKDDGTSTAINHLQQAGYGGIKIIDSHYFTAIPPNYDGITPIIGALDSLIVTAEKDGQTVKLKVVDVGKSTMTFQKL